MRPLTDALTPSVQRKLDVVVSLLSGFPKAIVAFSGGVDSTLLAKLAREVLGRPNAPAVTADSPSLAREDLEEAQRLAKALDLDHLTIPTHEVADPSYQRNTEARCYLCKRTLFVELSQLATARGIPAVLYGAIGDDHPADRPGQQAARAFGVRAPLQEAGLEKWEVRELALALSLPNWNRPPNACLSSRIPHGQPVTEEKLRQIEAAEALLHAHGFCQVRVRHTGAHARIEVEPDALRRFQDAALCAEIASAFEALGFETVGVDRAGYRAGGADHSPANEVLLTAISRC